MSFGSEIQKQETDDVTSGKNLLPNEEEKIEPSSYSNNPPA